MNQPLRGIAARACATFCAGVFVLAAALAAEPRSQAQITPNYKDADLGQIVEAVSQVTGKNFIIDPRVKAQVTMLSATPMSPDAFYEAFLAILQVHGFVAVQAGKVYKIVPDANARQLPANDLPDKVSRTSDEIVTQVVSLRNVNAAQLVPILRPLIPQYGHLAAYTPANVLIISDHASNVSRMMRIIERIDQGGDGDIEVIRLENAASTEIVKVINSLNQGAAGAEGGGSAVRLIADERTNSVLITGEKTQRLRLRALIAHLDTPLESGGGTQVRHLKYADAEKIAQKLKEQVQSSTAGAAAGAAGAQAAQDRAATIWAEPTTNSLVVTATPKLMRQLMGVVDKLDVRRPEVLVEAIIVEITGDKSADLGVNWLLDGSGTNIGAASFVSPVAGTSIAEIAAAAANPTTLTAGSVPTGTTFAVGRLQKTGTNFAAILRAARGDSNTNIISTPSVMTLNNQEAQIKVAQEVPFLTGQYASTGAAGATTGTTGIVNPFQTITRQEVGTILKITPQITDDTTILLKIEQEQSSLAQGAKQAVDLITNKRTISTKVLAQDGEIIVLGGLIEDNVLEGEQRVPFLGRIPLIGELFRTRNSSKTKTNLMVFIRAKILNSGAQTAVETQAKYDYIREQEAGRSRGKVQLLPGERQPQLPALNELQAPPRAPAPASPPPAPPAPDPAAEPRR
jgi:general secretion pathway protein D